MKKQIVILFTLFISFSLISCQKQDLAPSNESQLTAALTKSVSNVAQVGLPFKGSYTTSFEIIAPPPNQVQRVRGIGSASHLGSSTFEAISNVTVTLPPPFMVSGTRVITAANGDLLYTTFLGTSTPPVNGMNGADLQETITGGTGRFANATGSFTSMARNNFITSTFTVDFDGTINY